MARAAMMCCEPSPPRLRPAGNPAGDRSFPDFFLSRFSAAEREVVGTGGFEPPTCRLGGDRSIHLSYVPLPLHFTLPPIRVRRSGAGGLSARAASAWPGA